MIDAPDPDDRHVIAAAIHSSADLIVTFNLKDFPAAVLSQYNQVVSPFEVGQEFIREIGVGVNVESAGAE